MRRLLCLLCLESACSAWSTPARPACSHKLTLTQIGTGGGAIVVTISGGPVTAVHAPAGFDVVSNTDTRGTHIIFIGILSLGDLATIDVPDTTKAAAYIASVDQVADGTTYALIDARGFQAALGVVK